MRDCACNSPPYLLRHPPPPRRTGNLSIFKLSRLSFISTSLPPSCVCTRLYKSLLHPPMYLPVWCVYITCVSAKLHVHRRWPQPVIYVFLYCSPHPSLIQLLSIPCSFTVEQHLQDMFPVRADIQLNVSFFLLHTYALRKPHNWQYLDNAGEHQIFIAPVANRCGSTKRHR